MFVTVFLKCTTTCGDILLLHLVPLVINYERILNNIKNNHNAQKL